MKIKIAVFILSIIFSGYLLITLFASRHQSIVLNPFNSEYYYKERLLTGAIETEPSKALYHMHYGLELLKNLPKDKFSALIQLRLAKEELLRAVKLMPHNESYKKAFGDYSVWIDKQL
ncbi:MAG: hypothetical protein WC417_00990 [Candidatus Omnitrophota bacterium]|jgi:hypothetical protein